MNPHLISRAVTLEHENAKLKALVNELQQENSLLGHELRQTRDNLLHLERRYAALGRRHTYMALALETRDPDRHRDICRDHPIP